MDTDEDLFALAIFLFDRFFGIQPPNEKMVRYAIADYRNGTATNV